jgi:hypothetical protein
MKLYDIPNNLKVIALLIVLFCLYTIFWGRGGLYGNDVQLLRGWGGCLALGRDFNWT